jgi:hypothetical protein
MSWRRSLSDQPPDQHNRGAEKPLDGGWPSCGMTPGAEPNQVPAGRGSDQPTWACRSVVMLWTSRRVSKPAWTDASRFHSDRRFGAMASRLISRGASSLISSGRSPSDENCGQPQFAPPKSEGTHDVSPGLRPDAASTRSKRHGRQGKTMRRLRLPVLGAAIAAASIILASQAPPRAGCISRRERQDPVRAIRLPGRRRLRLVHRESGWVSRAAGHACSELLHRVVAGRHADSVHLRRTRWRRPDRHDGPRWFEREGAHLRTGNQRVPVLVA